MTQEPPARRRPPAARAARATRAAAFALVAVGLAVGVAAPALAEPNADAYANVAAAAPAAPATPVNAGAPGPGFSPPEWLPLRHDLDGGEITVGCTHQSHGSAHGYACGGHHDYWAIDFLASTGTPVYAAGRGYATIATGRSGASGYGNVVTVEHGDGISSLYAHLSRVLLPPEGAWVGPDTVIGLVGSTGTSSAPHLHYERRDAARPAGDDQVDPGPLKACILAKVVAFPQIRDEPTWDRLPWGTFSVFSDGTATACRKPATPAARHRHLTSGWLLAALAGIDGLRP